MEYRGIQLDESVKLYKKNGEYNKHIKKGLDELADLLAKNNHVLMSKFKKSIEKVLIDFNCGHEPHWIEPSNYKNGIGCPKCGLIIMAEKQIKKSKEEFLSLLKLNNHELLSEYKDTTEKVLIDFKCGHEPHWITHSSYKHKNRGCPKCSYITLSKKLSKQAKEEFPLIVESNGHKLLSEYKGIHEKVLIDFRCGHEPHLISPNSYKSGGNGCPKCSGVCPKAGEESLLKLIKKNKHKLLTSYKNAHTKVLIDFRCGHEPHWIAPSSYKNGISCPKCKESKGVKIICKWLDEKGIKYETEYKLPEKRWRYDIFIPSENLIVEVHGLQHYEFVEHFHKTKKVFYERDKIDYDKWKYACSLGYEYIEVDYREGKPELALKRFLAFNEFRRNINEIRRDKTRQEEQLSLI